MKNVIVITALIAAIAVSACRREQPEEKSYKLGGPAASVELAR